ncbi:MAG: hypothetical protein PHR96_04230 [Clostridia bacterium]|nr:hypothetical protein [Clostridia bacterium]
MIISQNEIFVNQIEIKVGFIFKILHLLKFFYDMLLGTPKLPAKDFGASKPQNATL